MCFTCTFSLRDEDKACESPAAGRSSSTKCLRRQSYHFLQNMDLKGQSYNLLWRLNLFCKIKGTATLNKYPARTTNREKESDGNKLKANRRRKARRGGARHRGAAAPRYEELRHQREFPVRCEKKLDDRVQRRISKELNPFLAWSGGALASATLLPRPSTGLAH